MTPPPPWTTRSPSTDEKARVEHGDNFAPLFDRDGLIPAVVTDKATGEMLMLAWMNDEALQRTLDTRYAHFWTRSRKRLWMKGEESGNRLAVKAVYTDCDQDVLHLEVEVEGNGVACHTGARSCFYREVVLEGAEAGPFKLKTIPVGQVGET